MIKYILICLILLSLVGCQERYRYPCQDPKNSNAEECKKHNCEISRTCPSILKDKNGN